MKKPNWEELIVEMIPHNLDEEAISQLLDEMTELIYDHLAKLRKDSHEAVAIESGSSNERTGS